MCVCAVPPPTLSIEFLDDAAVQGTVVHLQATATLNPAVNSPLTVVGEWSRQDMANLPQSIFISDTSQTSPYSHTLTFNPLRDNSDDGGVYVYMLTVSPRDSTYIESASTNRSIMIEVQEYPPLKIIRNVTTSVCGEQEQTSLFGNVSLLPNTALNSLTYSWTDPHGQPISTSTGGISVNKDNLILRNLTLKIGTYTLKICLTVTDSGLSYHCSSAPYSLSTTGKIFFLFFFLIYLSLITYNHMYGCS